MKQIYNYIRQITLNLTLGGKKATIIGHSWGGTLAMAFAAKFPEFVTQLILISPGLFKIDSVLKQTFYDNRTVHLCQDQILELNDYLLKDGNMRLNEYDSIRKLDLFNRQYIYEKSNCDTILAKINLAKNNEKTSLLLTSDMIKRNLDLTSSIKRFAKPITVITGRQDPLSFNSYELKIIKPSIHIYWISRCGHYPMFEQPSLLISLISKLLN